jgi:uncharacterized membrane protein
MEKILKFLTRYFVQGIIIIVPISILLYVLLSIFGTIGGWIESLGIQIHWAIDPFIGIFAMLVITLLIGFLGTSILLKPLFIYVEQLIEQAPVIKSIYGAVKDLVEAFVGNKKKFDQPVLVQLFDNAERLGFITSENLKELNIGEDKVAVFFPHSYAISGNVMIVPKDKVKPLNAPSAKVYKFLVSGGVA